MTVLSGHINTLYTKLVHLDKQVQIHCIYPHPQSDVIQVKAPDYNPDIEGDPEDTSTGTPKSEDHTTIPHLPIGLGISPQKFHQVSTAMNTTKSKNNEQNIPAITAPNWKTSQN